MNKPTITLTPEVPEEPTYSLTLTGLTRKDLKFLRGLAGRTYGSALDSPAKVTNELWQKLGDVTGHSHSSEALEIVCEDIRAKKYSDIP